MNTLLPLAFTLLLNSNCWTTQQSGTTARLRGVSAVSERVAWASGADGTVLRTTDGGANWQKLTVTTESLDFRDIDALDDKTAYTLSIGNGPASRIYKTVDAGVTWELQFKNENAKVFLDAMSFWDRDHGIAFGDSIDRQFYILITEDGGRTWKRVPPASLPQAQENEGAFAASGTNIAVIGKTHAWIATGAAAKARVLHTNDRGLTWKIVDTPLPAGPSAGIFSIAFRDAKNGVIVGGNYRKENEAVDNLAITNDGGETWQLVKGLSGYRSVVAYVPGSQPPRLVAIGPLGVDHSADDGRTWKPLPGGGFDSISFVPGKSISWATGAGGKIGKCSFGK
jgi:photosystem II stability/assembly factor-like uncharacterized protein